MKGKTGAQWKGMRILPMLARKKVMQKRRHQDQQGRKLLVVNRKEEEAAGVAEADGDNKATWPWCYEH